jgi:hypothetical protein
MKKRDYRTADQMTRDLNNHFQMLKLLEAEFMAEQERIRRHNAKAVASLSQDQEDAIAARIAARRDRIKGTGRLS